MITCCVIQGNIRSNTALVCVAIAKQFDKVILSTWEDEQVNFDLPSNVILLLNKKPEVAGYNNRNYQRYSTAQGLKKCKELGATFVMKWRTDMLPINLDVEDLITKALSNVPIGLQSRLVTCCFRCLTVEYDAFSTIPDLFAFGHISVMNLLWEDEGFDYRQKFNSPRGINEREILQIAEGNVNSGYCPEAELYALLKEKLEILVSKKLNHEQILRNYFYLIKHESLDILWFGDRGFRPILSLYYPWWGLQQWKGFRKVRKIPPNYPSSLFWEKISPYIINILTKYSIISQRRKFNTYLRNHDILNYSGAFK